MIRLRALRHRIPGLLRVGPPHVHLGDESALSLLRRRIGVTGQSATLDEQLTGRENLVLMARLRHLPSTGEVAERLLRAADNGDLQVTRPIEVNGIDLLARLPAETKLAPGDQVMLGIDPAHVIVLKD